MCLEEVCVLISKDDGMAREDHCSLCSNICTLKKKKKNSNTDQVVKDSQLTALDTQYSCTVLFSK